MRKWTLSEIAQIAEVVAAAAIVVSLVYVASEVQQNTNQVEAASLESGVGFIRAVMLVQVQWQYMAESSRTDS